MEAYPKVLSQSLLATTFPRSNSSVVFHKGFSPSRRDVIMAQKPMPVTVSRPLNISMTNSNSSVVINSRPTSAKNSLSQTQNISLGNSRTTFISGLMPKSSVVSQGPLFESQRMNRTSFQPQYIDLEHDSNSFSKANINNKRLEKTHTVRRNSASSKKGIKLCTSQMYLDKENNNESMNTSAAQE